MADDAATLATSNARPKPEPDAARPRRFSRAEFQAMIAAGIIPEGSRVELVGGEIIEMAGEGYSHEDGVTLLAAALEPLAGAARQVLMRARLDVDEKSETYPDILVQQRGVLVRDRSPSNVVLIVEVAVSSLRFDRDAKGPRYAAAGFAEFWIYEPALRRLWVHREPKPDGQWGLVFMRESEETIAPLFAPVAPVALPLVAGDSGRSDA